METHQYSVTSHKRSLTGGTAQDEGHKERLHARGGIPGVFFSFGKPYGLPSSYLALLHATLQDASNSIHSHEKLQMFPDRSPNDTNTVRLTDISPMKVINRETRTKSFSSFLVGVCAVIGGTLTVAAAIDRGLYAGSQQMKKMKER